MSRNWRTIFYVQMIVYQTMMKSDLQKVTAYTGGNFTLPECFEEVQWVSTRVKTGNQMNGAITSTYLDYAL